MDLGSASVSPDGRRMVAVGDTNEVFLFDVLHNGFYDLAHVFEGSEDASFSTDWSCSSSQFAVASQGASLPRSCSNWTLIEWVQMDSFTCTTSATSPAPPRPLPPPPPALASSRRSRRPSEVLQAQLARSSLALAVRTLNCWLSPRCVFPFFPPRFPFPRTSQPRTSSIPSSFASPTSPLSETSLINCSPTAPLLRPHRRRPDFRPTPNPHRPILLPPTPSPSLSSPFLPPLPPSLLPLFHLPTSRLTTLLAPRPHRHRDVRRTPSPGRRRGRGMSRYRRSAVSVSKRLRSPTSHERVPRYERVFSGREHAAGSGGA